MALYEKTKNITKKVYLVWVIQNFDIDGRRELHSVHTTQKGAILEEGLLPRDEYQYYSIETKEIKP